MVRSLCNELRVNDPLAVRPDAVARTTSGNRDGVADDLAVALDVCLEVDGGDG